MFYFQSSEQEEENVFIPAMICFPLSLEWCWMAENGRTNP